MQARGRGGVAVRNMVDMLRELVHIPTEQHTLHQEMIQVQRQQTILLHIEVQKSLVVTPPALREATRQPNPSWFIPKMTESGDF